MKIWKQIWSSIKGNNDEYIALDLGTVNTLVYISGQGIIYNEPSMIAYDLSKNKKVVALGENAFAMIGKVSENILISKPLVDGVISDPTATQDLLRKIFEKTQLLKIWKRAIVVLACPSGVTHLEREGLKQVAYSMGAKKVIVKEEVEMAAIGANINISLPSGNLVIDIGGGTSDVAVLASNGIIVSRSVKAAGNALDEEIIKYIRSQYNMSIGIKAAIDLKHNLSNLNREENEKKEYKIYGRDIVTGMPKEALITDYEITPLLLPTFEKIANVITQVLELTPAELSGDIIKNGLTICGGGALIKGVDKYFTNIFNFPAKVASDPLKCVIEGTKQIERELIISI